MKSMTYSGIKSTGLKSCTGCRMCEMVCSMAHDEGIINPVRSLIKICEDPGNGIYTPVVCHLCDCPACLEACGQEAISRNHQTGAIIISGKLCTGCGLCVDACEFNAIAIHAEKNIAVTCDLCSGKPQCVKYCLQEAIIFSK